MVIEVLSPRTISGRCYSRYIKVIHGWARHMCEDCTCDHTERFDYICLRSRGEDVRVLQIRTVVDCQKFRLWRLYFHCTVSCFSKSYTSFAVLEHDGLCPEFHEDVRIVGLVNFVKFSVILWESQKIALHYKDVLWPRKRVLLYGTVRPFNVATLSGVGLVYVWGRIINIVCSCPDVT